MAPALSWTLNVVVPAFTPERLSVMFPVIVTLTMRPSGGQRIAGAALTLMIGGAVSAAVARLCASSAKVITNTAFFDFVSVRFMCNPPFLFHEQELPRLTAAKPIDVERRGHWSVRVH